MTSPFERNRDPILEHLRTLINSGTNILEVGSGSGDHSQYFAKHLPSCSWQTTERAENFELLCQSIRRGARSDMTTPKQVDLLNKTWDETFEAQSFDVAIAINVIHIAAWKATPLLMCGVSKLLKPGGLLITYGPYRYRDQDLEPSNTSFEQDIQTKYPGSGLRVMEEVKDEAATHGLSLIHDHAMPANNRLLIFKVLSPANA